MMISSARQTLICVLLVLGAVVCVEAQLPAQKAGTGSVSGKITIKGKPAVGVLVAASDARNDASIRRNRARTDQTGSYRITNLPAATYQMYPLTPALVPANESDAIVVAEGEHVVDVNLELVPGAVITGRITDSDGEPLIGERVSIRPVSESFPRSSLALTRIYSTDNTTDDRGVYRAFGLPGGKYQISVGRSYSGIGDSRQYFKETFYPSVTDATKATIVEVTEGSEVNQIDIVVGRPVVTFKVAGLIVDGETGKPLPNIRFGVGQTIDVGDQGTSRTSSVGPNATNANGEFRLGNLEPGKYTIFTASVDGGPTPTASLSFQIVDRDLTGLIIKTVKSGSLSGVVNVEGSEVPDNIFTSLRLCVSESRTDSAFTGSRTAIVNQDGTFRIDGLWSGSARLWICSFNNRSQLEILRVEHNGVRQSQTINVREGEHVAGIRVLIAYQKLTGSIRGQVKIEEDNLPFSQILLMLSPLDENLQPRTMSSVPTPQLDQRGRFFVERLAAGMYRLTAYVLKPGGNRTSRETTQLFSVVDDTVTDVTLVIKRDPNEER
jgi:hypothetical protein